MSKNDLMERSRFAMIATLMTILSLVFLFYIGTTLISSTKKYHSQIPEMTSR